MVAPDTGLTAPERPQKSPTKWSTACRITVPDRNAKSVRQPGSAQSGASISYGLVMPRHEIVVLHTHNITTLPAIVSRYERPEHRYTLTYSEKTSHDRNTLDSSYPPDMEYNTCVAYSQHVGRLLREPTRNQ